MLRSVALKTRSSSRSGLALESSARAHQKWSRSQIEISRQQYRHVASCSKTSNLYLCRGKPGIEWQDTIARVNLKQATHHFSTSSKFESNAFHAITGYAFAGKPRTQKAEEEMQQQFTGNTSASSSSSASRRSLDKKGKTSPRQGFPPDSTIGRWVDSTLKEGEAGEDAILFERMRGDGDIAFGVSDGVGGWSEEGIDPALFSQSLMYHSAQYAKAFHACPERLETEEQDDNSTGIPQEESTLDATPSKILDYAYMKTLEQKEVPAGSATACILTFDASKGILRAANLGDSGFILLRPAINSEEAIDKDHLSTTAVKLSVHHQSKPQVFGFNAPFQLSKLPVEYRSENQIDCTPQKADLYKERVLDGDLVLVATDGFWDNVSVSEMLQLIQFIKEKHRAAFVDKMLDISNSPLAEEEDLATVLAHK